MHEHSGAADDTVGGARSIPAGLDADWLMVGRIGRAHGVRGDVLVEPRTDDPDQRFAAGAQLSTDPGTDPSGQGPLTVERSYWHSGKLVIHFVGVDDRNAAEGLRGIVLLVVAADRPALDDPDDFYDSDLIGLRALDRAGVELGVVVDVVHSAASDLLAIQLNRPALDGARSEQLVPFVREIVPTVDLAAGTLVVDAPEGLLELP